MKSTKSPDTEDVSVKTNKVQGTPDPIFYIDKVPRFALFQIKPSRGRLPDELKGTYTEKSRTIQDLLRVIPNAQWQDRTV